MARKRLLILFSEKTSPWWSCQSISPNLKAAYRALDGRFDLEWFGVSLRVDNVEKIPAAVQKEFVSTVQRFRPDELVLVDHLPHPVRLLSGLMYRKVEKRSELQRSDELLGGLLDLETGLKPLFKTIPFAFSLHVYGDFTISAARWNQLRTRVGLNPVRLICASPRQRELVRGFLAQPGGVSQDSCVAYAPFPVDCASWSFSEEIRDRARAKLGVAAGDRIILYAGRLSLQKGVLRLVREFASLEREGGRNLQLWLVGPFDDRDGLLMKINTPAGYLFSKFELLLKSLPESVRSRIRYLGPKGGADLHELYCAADAFASLSLYHDEDFGMAPAEALSCGLPAVLTDWGGYPGFAVPGVEVLRVPVELTRQGLAFESEAACSALESALASPGDTATRIRRGEAFSRRFSVQAVSATLQEIYQAPPVPFPGFNSRIRYLSKLMESPKPQQDLIPTIGAFYEEIYAPYIREKEGVAE